MEEHTGKYMVEFILQDFYDINIEEVLELQKEKLADYFYQGKIFSFTVSNDLKKMWMIVLVDSESELISVVDSLPISPYSEYTYGELLLHHTVQYIPEHSLN